MALGPTTYKTTNIINSIGSNLTAREGCGLVLSAVNQVDLATNTTQVPYGILVTGTDSLTPGTYPSPIGDAALELVDQLGCCVQVLISSDGNVSAGEFLIISANDGDGTFVSTNVVPSVAGDWVWGYALTASPAGGQFLARFQPYKVYSLT